MSFRINTNTQAASALTSLNKTTDGIANRQMRLATGSRINSAADDSAGFTISNKLKATTRGQAQALSNIGDAKSMLTVAEGALGSTMDILQTMKEKAVQAGNSSMGAEERAAIQSQVDALGAEVSDILGTANFNGTKLFSDDAAGTNLSFQVGDKSGDTFGAKIDTLSVGSLGLGTATAAVAGTPEVPESAPGAGDGTPAVAGTPASFTSSIDLTDDAGVAEALTTIDAAISTINKTASGLGDVQNRLDFKSQNLETSMNNYDSARSRIADADFAKEQMEVVKLQILQQTGSAMFAQANSSGQSVLSFF